MSDVKLGKYPQIYKTSDYKVTMLRIGDADDKTFLINVDGVDNDFDGQIISMKKNVMILAVVAM